MKAKKTLKRLTQIEEIVSDVTYKYEASTKQIKEALREAKAAIIRAKQAVLSQIHSRKRNASSSRPKDKAAKRHRMTATVTTANADSTAKRRS